jgi:hypothetical protein
MEAEGAHLVECDLVQRLSREWSCAGSNAISNSIKQRGGVEPARPEPGREHAKGWERRLGLVFFERSYRTLQLEIQSAAAVLLPIAGMVEVGEQAGCSRSSSVNCARALAMPSISAIPCIVTRIGAGCLATR